MAEDIPTRSMRPGPRVTLVAQLVLFATIIAVGAVVASGYLGYSYTLEALRTQIEQKFQLLSRERQSRIESYVSQQHERIRLVKSRTRLRRLTSSYLTDEVDHERFLTETVRILQDALESTTSFRQICVVTLEGTVISSTNEGRIGQQLENDFFFQQGTLREYYEEPQLKHGAYISRLSAPLTNQNGEVIAVLIVHLDADPLIQALQPDTAVGFTSKLTIGRLRDGVVRTLLDNPHGEHGDIENVIRDAISGGTGFRATQSSGGLFAYWAPFQLQENDHSNWGFVATVDMDEALRPIVQFRYRVYQLVFGVLAFAMGLAYLGARRLTEPLRRLTKAANELEQHPSHIAVPQGPNDEVGDLTIAFNNMSQELARKHQELVNLTVNLQDDNQHMFKELAIAGRLQEALYPSAPLNVEGFEIYGLTMPAEQLCGDYYDYFPSQDGTFTVALGDVSGHGTGPALMMVETRAIIHSLICNNVPLENWSPQLNRLLFEDSPEGRFVSLFVAQINPVSREIRYIGAGHNAWIIAQDGSTKELGSTGMLLGLDEVPAANVRTSSLSEEDILFIASDGLYETRNEQQELYGVQRLLSYLQSHRSGCLQSLFTGIVNDVRGFGGNQPFKDDLTAVAVKVHSAMAK